MTRTSQAINLEAAAWRAASTRDDMDWEGFTSWLEADCRHRAAYDEVALTDVLLSQHKDSLTWPDEPAPPLPAYDDPEAAVGRGQRRFWLGTALVASLVALIAGPRFWSEDSTVYRSQAAPVTIALRDGSTVVLAPRSRLEISGVDQTQIALEGGAWFDIRHDPSRSLAVSAAGLTISDIGTRFDVQSVARQLRVEVGDGEVTVNGSALSAPLRIVRGRALAFDAAAGTALVKDVRSADIGEWRTGRLSYDSTPLALVAADLSRYAGISVALADGVSQRTFSGTLVIGDGERTLHDLAELMDLGIVGGSGRYRLHERR
jgi:transmembrane sensor